MLLHSTSVCWAARARVCVRGADSGSCAAVPAPQPGDHGVQSRRGSVQKPGDRQRHGERPCCLLLLLLLLLLLAATGAGQCCCWQSRPLSSRGRFQADFGADCDPWCMTQGSFIMLLVLMTGGFVIPKQNIHPWVVWLYWVRSQHPPLRDS